MLVCSACYAALEQWEKAAEDGRQCILANKSFVKGYFRYALGLQNLSEHRLFTGFDESPVGETKVPSLEHSLDQAIAIVTRFETVDFCAQGLSVSSQIVKAANSLLCEIGGNSQGVFGVFNESTDARYITRVEVGLDIGIHTGGPVAQEEIDISLFHRAKGYGNRQLQSLSLIAEILNDPSRHSRGHSNICPANLGKAHERARVILGRERAKGEQEEQKTARAQHT